MVVGGVEHALLRLVGVLMSERMLRLLFGSWGVTLRRDPAARKALWASLAALGLMLSLKAGPHIWGWSTCLPDAVRGVAPWC